MKQKILPFIYMILLGASLWVSQLVAQDVDVIDKAKYIAGVRMSEAPPRYIVPSSSPVRFDTLFSFLTPGIQPGGVAWDGQYFWNSDANTRLIYKLTETGSVVSSFSLPTGSLEGGGLAWDGMHLWLADEKAAILFKIDPATGLAVAQYNLPSFGQGDPNGYDLTWDGQYLWHSEYASTAMIYKLDPQNGQVISSFVPPKDIILGIAWSDGFLYGVNIEFASGGGRLYKFDPATGAALDSAFWEVPYPLGLTWDGQFFWNVSGRIPNGNQRIYKVSNPLTSIDNGFPTQPDGFTLAQNYPNPFNPSTTIKYHLAATNDVELKIYNQVGQEIKTLVQARQSLGSYQVEWDGRDNNRRLVPSGIYYYRLKAGEQRESRKMILVR